MSSEDSKRSHRHWNRGRDKEEASIKRNPPRSPLLAGTFPPFPSIFQFTPLQHNSTMNSFGLSRTHHQTVYPLLHSVGAKMTCSPPPLSVVCSDHSQFPTYAEFKGIVEDYLENLSPKKRDKALVDDHRYQLILQVLKDPKNTSVSTAQFRFWVKKMFKLAQVDSMDGVFHDKKPVATKEKIYDILVRAHGEVHHGGRDKTSALVRRRFSWIPKELIARFVRNCPFCISRRNGSQSPISSDFKTPSPTTPFSEPTLSTAPTTPVDYDQEEFEMKPEQNLFRGTDEYTPPPSPVSSYKPLSTDIDLENNLYLSAGTEASSSDITPGLGYGSVPYSYSYRTTARYPMLPAAFPVDLAMAMSTMEPQPTHRHSEYQHNAYTYGQDMLGMTTGEHPVGERDRGGSEGVNILSHQQQYLRNYHAQQTCYLHHMQARLADCMVIRNGLMVDGAVNREGYLDQAF
ncbi:hypothetical protein BC937DRAFT_94843 [Endogone sp. FLAS-F59071]|nr:hypothetical protein BC937DRAFT_94843 [Endogone sp. FLAS-F59071]|eukprot:RUS13741.1 hypothetical protein BC937DRAFT_94843 [Endogone sp. FLAS-F59071]